MGYGSDWTLLETFRVLSPGLKGEVKNPNHEKILVGGFVKGLPQELGWGPSDRNKVCRRSRHLVFTVLMKTEF